MTALKDLICRLSDSAGHRVFYARGRGNKIEIWQSGHRLGLYTPDEARTFIDSCVADGNRVEDCA